MISIVTPTLEMNSHIRHNQSLLMDDSRVTEYIVVEGISPVSKARQVGLDRANSDYVLWLDSDIELRENPLDMFMSLFHKGGVAGYTMTVPDTVTNVFKRVHEEVHFSVLPELYESTVCMFECGLYDRSKMVEAGGFDRVMVAGEDNYMVMKLRRLGYPCYRTKKIIADHYYDSHNLGAKQRGYGQGVREMKRIFGEDYSIFETARLGFGNKWRLRIKTLQQMGKLHLLPLLPLYNLYIGEMFRRGMQNESCE